MLYKKILFNSSEKKFAYSAEEILDIVREQTMLSREFQGILLPKGCIKALQKANAKFMVYPDVKMYNIKKLYGYDILEY